ncbi:MAG: type II secretion system protein GspJ, partial [Candidatus Binatus sp.]
IVTYNLTPNPDQPGWYLLQRSQQSGLLTSTAALQSMVLADNVLSLHFRYFDGQKWAESWDSSSMPRGVQLPVAVAIQIQMAAPGGHVMDFATQVTVPMAIQQW